MQIVPMTEPSPQPENSTDAPAPLVKLLDLITPRCAERQYGVRRSYLAALRRSASSPATFIVHGCMMYQREAIRRIASPPPSKWAVTTNGIECELCQPGGRIAVRSGRAEAVAVPLESSSAWSPEGTGNQLGEGKAR